MFNLKNNTSLIKIFKSLLKFFKILLGWGAHHSNAPCAYITAAAALGMKKSDVELFIHRLDKALSKVKGRSAPPSPTSMEDYGSSGRRSGSRVVNGESNDQGSSAGTSLTGSKDSLRK